MIELAIAGLALSLGSTLLNFRQNQKSISRQEPWYSKTRRK